MKRTLYFLMSLLAATSIQVTADEANVEAIKGHLRFLSHDLLEGRDTGSRGHEIASLYIATQLQQFGLKPAGDDGTFMQRITFRQSFLDQDSPSLSLSRDGEKIDFDYPKQYIAGPSAVYEDAHVSGEMVFAGYGIVAPRLNHNDYEGLDVKGKIVVQLSGKPKSFPSEEGAHFASGSEKSRYAVEAGAIGIITISTPTREKVRPYQTLLNYLHTPRVRWMKPDGEPANVFPAIKNSAYFSKEAAEVLFEGAEMSLEEIYAALEKDETPEGFALKGTISLSKKSEFKEVTSPNVVALLPGSDNKLKDQYVVYTAHSDHIGFAKTVKKDKINNGAMDNASGTAVLLETARLFSQLEKQPKRSILFVAVTGEEKGLLGSDYYAQNPTVDADKIVANVNLDMPVLTYEFGDIIAFGANHSDLNDPVTKAAKAVNLEVSPDPWPEQAIFTRSDHYSFVKEGVPAVYIIPGLKASDGSDGSKIFWNFLGTHYHKPSDEFNDSFNWAAAKKFADVNFSIGRTIANQKAKPKWNKGDFFGDTFSK